MQLQNFFGLIKLCKKPRGSMTTIVLTSSNHKNINHDNRSIAEHNGDIFLTIGVPTTDMTYVICLCLVKMISMPKAGRKAG